VGSAVAAGGVVIVMAGAAGITAGITAGTDMVLAGATLTEALTLAEEAAGGELR